MPRIDPLSLLRCLSVLLGPNGGIKSKDEVIRLANLMTKFSKKLVSKCIYIQILKSTNPDLLSQFMGAGGWNLVHMWLTDGILAKNWALIQELLELLLLCPVDIERLKSNNCPKLIKGLSKEGSHQGVRTLASRLVEQWLKMVKGEATPTVVAVQAIIPSSIHSTISQNSIAQCLQPNASITPVTSQNINSENAVTVQSSDLLIKNSVATQPVDVQQQTIKAISPQKTQMQISAHALDKQQTVSSSISPSSVYKITIRDGKKVLTQVQTDVANINAISVSSLNTEVNGDADNVLPTEDERKNIIHSESVIERISAEQRKSADEVSKEPSSEVKENTISLKNVDESDSIKNKERKDEKDISSDGKSTSDKENRDKKDDKKSVNSNASSDKKSSSHTLSSNKSSSKHSSSSSKHSSSKHSSSSHRSSSKNSSSSSSSRDKSSKDKEKDKHHSSSSSKSSSSKSKTERDKEKEKEKLKKDQAEKDKATLEKLQSPALSTKMGKIPKKKADEEKSEDSSSRKFSTDSKDSFKENKDKLDIKKVATVSEKKNISISIENRKNSQDQTSRPKTVKTFNSKFRSTGLEEEVKPPPHRGAKKSVAATDKKVLPSKLPLKRLSPFRESGTTPDKKAKFSLDPTNSASDEKKGGIKLIPAKPKLMLLQESDMFMDALTASTKSKEPRKRKRRTSITKDGLSDSKKNEIGNNDHNRDTSSPPSSPTSPPSHSGNNKDDKSLLSLKPAFKFYQDTLETDEEKDDKNKSKAEGNGKKGNDVDSHDSKKIKRENKEDDDVEDDERSRTPTPEDDFDDMKSSDSPEDPAAAVSEALKKEEHATLENRPIGVLKSVLLLQKRKGPKKSLKWKTDLESVRFFELDETERVNVTKTFTDMKQMEKQNEREAFQMARKLSSEDVMEEKTLWKALILIDMPPPLVEPGKDSREKDIQYAREKGILQALYFNRSMIPDSPAEPDEERHHIFIEPKVIPLDDLTGNKDSEKDFTGIPWPEPKPPLPAPSTIIQNPYFQSFRPNQQQMMPPMGSQPPMAPMAQQMINSIPQIAPEMTSTMPPTSGGGGGWRTGDGKIVVPDTTMTPMTTMPTNYPQTMEGAPMVPPNMMGPPMYSQEGYIMGPEDMGYNNFQGPPGPGMYGPPVPGGPPPPGPPFQGPRGPPMHGNRGRGGPPGPGWFRGGPPRGMPWRGGWRGNGKQPPVCRQFSKNGYCRVGDKCQYLHPGVNCPPF